MEKLGTVYALKNRATGKIYVGSTGDIQTRIQTHMSQLRNHKHHCRAMQADFDAYGDNFSFTVLYQGHVSGKELVEIERAYMTILRTRDQAHGYNDKDPSKDFRADIDAAWTPIPKARVAKAVISRVQLLRDFESLPDALQNDFVAQLHGAAAAVRVLAGDNTKEVKDNGDSSG